MPSIASAETHPAGYKECSQRPKNIQKEQETNSRAHREQQRRETHGGLKERMLSFFGCCFCFSDISYIPCGLPDVLRFHRDIAVPFFQETS